MNTDEQREQRLRNHRDENDRISGDGWIDQVELPEMDAWAEQEAAFERFLGEHEQIDVLMMLADEFEAWKAEYKRLYLAVFDAQIAYYNTIMGVTA